MGVTYTAAATRDARLPGRRVGSFDLTDLALVLTSCVAVAAIALACAGRLSVFDRAENARVDTRIVDLNTVVDAGQLESAMTTVFGNVGDRRFASQELLRFLVDQRRQGRSLPNVGAVARANVDAASIDRSRNLDSFAQRLQSVRQN